MSENESMPAEKSPSPARRRAVFFDRDGTLNHDPGYLHRPEHFEWIEGVPAAIRSLNDAEILVLVVTNQSAVARGICSERDVRQLHAFMETDLTKHGAWIDAFYYSPFHPEGTVAPYNRVSQCRKPGTAMIDRAVGEWAVDRAASFMVGDRASDMEAGKRAGLTSLLVQTGLASPSDPDELVTGEASRPARDIADHLVPDAAAAVQYVLSVDG